MGGRDSRISEPGALSWQRSAAGGDEKLDGRRPGPRRSGTRGRSSASAQFDRKDRGAGVSRLVVKFKGRSHARLEYAGGGGRGERRR